MLLGLIKLLAFGLLLALLAAVWMVVDRLRSPPRRTMAWAVSRRLPSDPSELNPPRHFRAIEVPCPTPQAPRRVLPAWDIAGDNPFGPIVLAAHGWGDAKLGILPRLPALARHASRIVALDFTAHGDAPLDAGRCALGTQQDVRDFIALAQVATAKAEASSSQPPLLLYGWSLGAGVCIVAARPLVSSGIPVAAVIAEAPYREARTPVLNYLRLLHLPWRFNAPVAMAYLGWRLGAGPRWAGFDRAAHARDLPCPLLVLHGADDEICPHADGQAIAAAAAPRSIFLSVPGAQHNNLWTEEPYATQCAHAVGSFIMSITEPGTAPAASPSR